MARFYIENLLLSVTRDQFVDMTSHFAKACAGSWDTAVDIKLRVLSRPLSYSTFYHEGDAEFFAAENERATIFATDNLRELDPATFARGVHIDADIRPVKAEDQFAPPAAFAMASYSLADMFESQRASRRKIRFYVQPDGDDIAKRMKRRYQHIALG